MSLSDTKIAIDNYLLLTNRCDIAAQLQSIPGKTFRFLSCFNGEITHQKTEIISKNEGCIADSSA